jgi:electron transfer flavoprotein beta subunit
MSVVPPLLLAVCWKWVDRRPDIDPLTGAVQPPDARFGGVSEADLAALELALQIAQRWNARVRVVTAGPRDADRSLRHALAVGAHEVQRVDMSVHADSAAVAAALAGVVGDAAVVWCGDYSADRGSGSVPAYLAARLRAASALGAVAVASDGEGADAGLTVTRRLDGGRREMLHVTAPAVVSVEGAAATLRRGGLTATLYAERAEVPVTPGPIVGEGAPRPLRPFRPRARELAPPQGVSALERVRELTGSAGATTTHRTEVAALHPEAAARRILELLHSWGGVDDAR